MLWILAAIIGYILGFITCAALVAVGQDEREKAIREAYRQGFMAGWVYKQELKQ